MSVSLVIIRWFSAGKNYMASLLPAPPNLKKESAQSWQMCCQSRRLSDPLKNSLYVKTSLLGLKVHMESSGRAPGENVLKGIF